MKWILCIALLVSLSLDAQQDYMKQDSLPAKGKTSPKIIGSPPLSPAQLDTFYPSRIDTMRKPIDSLQRDDRKPKPRGVYRDTIPR